MVISQHPIRTTIFFGLICGLSFIPANLALSYLLHGASVINLTLWLYAAGYALLLSRWSKKPILSAGFPLLLLFVTSFLVDSITAFYLLSLVVISWIRTAICFRNSGGVKLVVATNRLTLSSAFNKVIYLICSTIICSNRVTVISHVEY